MSRIKCETVTRFIEASENRVEEKSITEALRTVRYCRRPRYCGQTLEDSEERASNREIRLDDKERAQTCT